MLLYTDDKILDRENPKHSTQKLQELITEKRLSQKVLLPGRFESDELYAWYLCASGFVLPSTYEPFGAVVNEALIFGLPVFCSKYAGASFLVNSGKGLLFDPLDKQNTMNGLSDFLSMIHPLKDIDLKSKPALMTNNQDAFVDEWNKIAGNSMN